MNKLSTFSSDLQELKVVTKERHILFVQDVKKVREYVNFKIQELREDMSKEIAVAKKITLLLIRRWT